MAKPDNFGRVVLIVLSLAIIFFLLNYLVKEATKFVPMHEYLLLTFVICQFIQIIFFTNRAYKKMRKERMGEVRYQIYLPPLYTSIIISGALGLVCSGYALFLNTDSFARMMGMMEVFVAFLLPGFYLLFRIMKYGKAYLKITKEEFIYYRKSELKILFREVEWVDYVTKRMDARRKDDKIGIVFKLLNGREIEVNTWRWGFSQQDVTNLMRDIHTKMS